MIDAPRYIPFLDLLNQAVEKETGQPLYVGGGEEIEALEEKVRAEFGVTLPEEYATFLSEADGFDYDGSCFYGVDVEVLKEVDEEFEEEITIPGILEKNRAWGLMAKPEPAQYLILGHSDLWLYGYHPATKTFHALWNDRQVSAQQFTSFDDLMVNALKEALSIPLKEN